MLAQRGEGGAGAPAGETQTLALRGRGAGTPWPTLMMMLLLINVVLNAYELFIIIATTYRVPNKGRASFCVLDVQYCNRSSSQLGRVTSESLRFREVE